MDETTESLATPQINTIVIAGGGVSALIAYGALRETHKQEKWHIDNIKNIYGTSAGGALAVIIALKYDWDVLDDFFIKRPWHQICKIDMSTIFAAYQNRGVLGVSFMEDTFKSLFSGRDMPIDINMADFYQKTGIEVHLFATELNDFELCDISYKTHPEWRVVDAVYASCALPLIFMPLIKSEKCYSDGGIIMNYPLSVAIANGCVPNETLGLPRNVKRLSSTAITAQSTIADYFIHFMNKIMEILFSIHKPLNIHENSVYEIPLPCSPVSIYDLHLASYSMEERTRLIQLGSDHVIAKE